VNLHTVKNAIELQRCKDQYRRNCACAHLTFCSDSFGTTCLSCETNSQQPSQWNFAGYHTGNSEWKSIRTRMYNPDLSTSTLNARLLKVIYISTIVGNLHQWNDRRINTPLSTCFLSPVLTALAVLMWIVNLKPRRNLNARCWYARVSLPAHSNDPLTSVVVPCPTLRSSLGENGKAPS
jgi:hypothetical protein